MIAATAALCAGAAPAGAPAASLSLEFEVVDAIGWRGPLADRVPAKVVETYSYDQKGDELTIQCRFDFPARNGKNGKNGKNGFCPLPPILALAIERGFPATIEPAAGPARPAGHICPIGPLMGVSDADGYRCRIKGLGRYVLARPALGDGKAPDGLLAELRGQVERVLDANGPLAPWLVLVNVPGSGADNRGDVYWQNPSETPYLLAEAAPLLDPPVQARLREYLRKHRQSLPPEMVRGMKLTEGLPREACPHDPALLKKWQASVLAYRFQGEVPIWSLYGLARYYELMGQKPDRSIMERCGAIVQSGLKDRDWATLYWRRGRTPEFNAVHAANQLFAGLVGYIRLARAAGEAEAEALGWGLLGRTAALRYAMGKYTQFQHARRMLNVNYRGDQGGTIRIETDPRLHTIPADPAWWIKADGGQWIGNLRTFRWTRPEDDVRQVHRLDEQGVDVWEWGGVDCGGTGQKRPPDAKDYWYGRLAPYYLPFADITPELGRFLADHLRPESEAFLRRVEENQPHWHIAYAEAIVGAEIGFMTPRNAHELLLAKAWVLGDKPRDLEGRIDVPWLPRGDLFHISKLAAAIKAYRGVRWD